MSASDADIVHLAAPWPGNAARLLEGLAALGPGTWPLEQICQAAGSGIEIGFASQILTGLAKAGVCLPAVLEDHWTTQHASAELLRLGQMLTGAEHFRRMRLDPAVIELAITMPLVPSHLEREIAPLLGRPGGYLSTTAAFTRIAQTATRRLTIMTPFIDGAGFRWLRRIVEAARPQCEKIVILRDAERYAVEIGLEHADWLKAFEVSIRDYHLPHDAKARALPIETFHGKLVVADDVLAYVGSANLLNSSEGLCLETGLLVEGAVAADVARLTDAVLRIARPL